MPEIKPDLSDDSRCISVHWNLPAQCVLPSSHRENWHEAWHPQNGNRLRYRRSFGNFITEDLHHGEWHDLHIPPPSGFCNDQHSSYPNVRCTGQYGHGWNHRAVVDGCTYSWNTPIPKGLTVDQLTRDVKQLRGMAVEAHARIAELESTTTAVAYRVLDGMETVAAYTTATQARLHCEFLARREHRGDSKQELFWRLDENSAHLEHGPEYLVESTAPGYSRLTGFAISPIPIASVFNAEEA